MTSDQTVFAIGLVPNRVHIDTEMPSLQARLQPGPSLPAKLIASTKRVLGNEHGI